MRRLAFRPAARDDIDDLTGFIGMDSIDAAVRLIRSIAQTSAGLCERPGIGHAREDLPRGYRAIRVRGFENHLIIYRYDSRRVTVVRVLHGARDFGTIFDLIE